jgi:hypothetical protein
MMCCAIQPVSLDAYRLNLRHGRSLGAPNGSRRHPAGRASTFPDSQRAGMLPPDSRRRQLLADHRCRRQAGCARSATTNSRTFQETFCLSLSPCSSASRSGGHTGGPRPRSLLSLKGRTACSMLSGKKSGGHDYSGGPIWLLVESGGATLASCKKLT